MRRLLLALPLGFLLVVAFLSCGGGGGTGSGTGGGTQGQIASIVIDQSSPTLFEGSTFQFTATAKDSGGNIVSGTTLKWTSSATNIAVVDNNGFVTSVVPGTTTITVSYGTVTSPGIALPVLPAGVLKGSVNFTGPYPVAGIVNYTTTTGTSTTVKAYPGQIVVCFNVTASGGTSSAAIAQREAIISSKNGTVIGKVPLIGFYLVRVQAGQENAIIQAMVSGGYGVDVAVPNGVAIRGASTPVIIDDSCWIDSNCNGTPVTHYVPLNVGGGIVILDDFNVFQGANHGNDVFQTAVNNGGTVSAKVQLPLNNEGGVPLDKLVASVVVIQQGAAIFSPGQNVTTNLSFNAGEEKELWYDENWEALAKMMDTAIKSVKDQLPNNQKDKFTLVQEIGNSGQDISGVFGPIHDTAENNGISGNHLYVGGSDGTYATQVTNQNYHNDVAWYKGCIAPNKCGSSFAAPAVAAMIDQVAKQTGTPVGQLSPAVLKALAENPNASPSQIIAAAVINTATPPLTGTWKGTWAWSGPGSNGCSFNDGGSFSMTLTQTGTSFSGSTSGSGIQTRDDATCALMNTDSGSGSASGTISGTTLNLSFNLGGSITTLSFTGTGTLNVNTLTASFVRSTGGSGSFTLTRQ